MQLPIICITEIEGKLGEAYTNCRDSSCREQLLFQRHETETPRSGDTTCPKLQSSTVAEPEMEHRSPDSHSSALSIRPCCQQFQFPAPIFHNSFNTKSCRPLKNKSLETGQTKKRKRKVNISLFKT